MTRPPRILNEGAVMKQNKLSFHSTKCWDCLTALNWNAIHRAFRYADADYDCGKKEWGRDEDMEGRKEQEEGMKILQEVIIN